MTSATFTQKVIQKIERTESDLERMVVAKKMIKKLDAIVKGSIAGANVEYLGMKEKLGEDEKVKFEDCILQKYTPSAKYQYSNTVIELEEKLKATKKIEQKTGVATKLNAEVDTNKTPLFTVKIG